MCGNLRFRASAALAPCAGCLRFPLHAPQALSHSSRQAYIWRGPRDLRAPGGSKAAKTTILGWWEPWSCTSGKKSLRVPCPALWRREKCTRSKMPIMDENDVSLPKGMCCFLCFEALVKFWLTRPRLLRVLTWCVLRSSATLSKMIKEFMPSDLRLAGDATDMLIDCCTGECRERCFSDFATNSMSTSCCILRYVIPCGRSTVAFARLFPIYGRRTYCLSRYKALLARNPSIAQFLLFGCCREMVSSID